MTHEMFGMGMPEAKDIIAMREELSIEANKTQKGEAQLKKNSRQRARALRKSEYMNRRANGNRYMHS